MRPRQFLSAQAHRSGRCSWAFPFERGLPERFRLDRTVPDKPAGPNSISVMRMGPEKEGVVGLRRTGLPVEHEPGLSVRFMGIYDKAITSYLVTAYHSAAVLVPGACGILEDVEVHQP
ncbi:hypothetical protein [Acrocarpospora sp. B8E8]|uniref:hypothetical protein n=1 Tax=Acrocarpospora sp. B8E8 TaxID=3153572 RepID=UPI00325C66A8